MYVEISSLIVCDVIFCMPVSWSIAVLFEIVRSDKDCSLSIDDLHDVAALLYV